jgi:hypothetical protein
VFRLIMPLLLMMNADCAALIFFLILLKSEL